MSLYFFTLVIFFFSSFLQSSQHAPWRAPALIQLHHSHWFARSPSPSSPSFVSLTLFPMQVNVLPCRWRESSSLQHAGTFLQKHDVTSRKTVTQNLSAPAMTNTQSLSHGWYSPNIRDRISLTQTQHSPFLAEIQRFFLKPTTSYLRCYATCRFLKITETTAVMRLYAKCLYWNSGTQCWLQEWNTRNMSACYKGMFHNRSKAGMATRSNKT